MNPSFIIIGENIHTTRVIRRTSARITDDPVPAVAFTNTEGEACLLPIPAEELDSQDYAEGRVKHVRAALRLAMSGDEVGDAYLKKMAAEQIRSGAAFLDVNVDEYSYRLAEQIAAMTYLVRLLAGISSVPLSIDSSNEDILQAGMAAAQAAGGASPMLNSASLERTAVLDVARDVGGPVIVTAAGDTGMPTSAEERVANASKIIDTSYERGIPADLVYIDPLMFPISVDGAFGGHVLDAIRELRRRYGSEIHITGGMSNVSFGLPHRRLINDAFLALAIEAGADSGIIDPIANDIERVLGTDRSAKPFRMALDVLSGADRNCRAYIRAARAGELTYHAPLVS